MFKPGSAPHSGLSRHLSVRLRVTCALAALALTAVAPASGGPAIGGTIAFVQGGNYDIYVVAAGSREPAFVWDELALISEVSLSPDASQLVFDSDGRGGFWDLNLFTINVDGTGRAQLTDLGADEVPTRAAWSPRGDLLAYGSYVAKGADEHASVTIVEPDGAGARVLASTPEPEARLTSLAWSPLGRDIVYTNLRDGVGADMMLHRITAEEGKLVTGLGGFGTAWSPDGAYLAFMSGVDGGGWGVYVIPAQHRADPRLVIETTYTGFSLAWVDDRHIAYLSADDNRVIQITDIDGMPQQPLDVGATGYIQAFDWVDPARDVRPTGKLATILGRLKANGGSVSPVSGRQ